MKAPTGIRGAKAPIELRLVVWQFVRVMVQLETASRARGRRSAPSLYGAWRPAWQEIDRRLTQLGKTDATGYSDLMMEQEVVVQCRNRAQLNELVRTVDNIINQLKSGIKAASGDPRAVADLRFERTELETLGRHLRKVVKTSGRSPPRPRAKPAAKPAKPAKSTGRRGAKR